MALALSVYGLVFYGPVSFAGMMIGNKEKQAIDRGELDPSTRGTAQAAFVVGLIGTIPWVLAFAFLIFAIVVFVLIFGFWVLVTWAEGSGSA